MNEPAAPQAPQVRPWLQAVVAVVLCLLAVAWYAQGQRRDRVRGCVESCVRNSVVPGADNAGIGLLCVAECEKRL